MAPSAESATRRPLSRTVRRLVSIGLTVAAVALAREAAFRVQDRRLATSKPGPATYNHNSVDGRVKP